jgi:hypothetical protein
VRAELAKLAPDRRRELAAAAASCTACFDAIRAVQAGQQEGSAWEAAARRAQRALQQLSYLVEPPACLQSLLNLGAVPQRSGCLTAESAAAWRGEVVYWHAFAAKCLAAIRREALAPPDEGVVPPDLFYWKSESHKLSPQLWNLLSCLWGRDSVPLAEVETCVWGQAQEQDTNIRTALSRLNAKLLSIGAPWEYHVRGKYIVRD